MKWLLSILLIAISVCAYADRKSKIIEVQDKIRKDASLFIEKFAPNSKYSISVDVVPLTLNTEVGREEDLPFMEFQEDLYLDPWDDSKSDFYTLVSRIKKVEIILFLGPDFKISNRGEFKEALLREINLVPGRDKVSFDEISSVVKESEIEWRDKIDVFLLGVMFIIAALLAAGLNVLFRRDRSNSKAESSNAGQSVNAPSYNYDQGIKKQPNTSTAFKGDLHLQDPTKLTSIVMSKVKELTRENGFPQLKDMIILEQLLVSEPLSFSYLVYEFPEAVQKDIYSKGRGENWFNGFSEVGLPSQNIIRCLDQMRRDRTLVGSTEFEELLICAWRLGNKNLSKFVSGLDKNLALNILNFLPKDMAIPVAKECFPGGWGEILEGESFKPIEDQIQIKKLIEMCLNIESYFDYKALKIFRERKDLLRYLDKVEPREEKEIYNVIGDKSDLRNIRPPFFPFFELSEEKRKEVFRKFSINDWVVACFDVEREYKEKVTSLLSDKEKFIFSHGLKTIDMNPDMAASKSDIRHRIALHLFESIKLEDLREELYPESNDVKKSA